LADDPSSTKFYIPPDLGKSGILSYPVILPRGVTCNQCVVQWVWKTGNLVPVKAAILCYVAIQFLGNTWAECNNGTGAIGCGDQETFINCADVAILTNVRGQPPEAVEGQHSEVGSQSSAARTSPRSYVKKFEDVQEDRGVVRSQVCVPRKEYSHLAKMRHWCKVNCLKYEPNCDPAKCTCL